MLSEHARPAVKGNKIALCNRLLFSFVDGKLYVVLNFVDMLLAVLETNAHACIVCGNG